MRDPLRTALASLVVVCPSLTLLTVLAAGCERQPVVVEQNPGANLSAQWRQAAAHAQVADFAEARKEVVKRCGRAAANGSDSELFYGEHLRLNIEQCRALGIYLQEQGCEVRFLRDRVFLVKWEHPAAEKE